MNPLLGAGLFTGGVGLIGSAVQSGLNYRAVKETNRANLENAEKDRQFQLQMWRMTNQYNSPSAQVNRLLAAGINPVSQFGSGDIVGNSSTMPDLRSTPSLQAPSLSGIPDAFISTSQGMLSSALMKAQIDNLNSHTKVNLETLPARIEGMQIQNDSAKLYMTNIAEDAKLTAIQRENLVQGMEINYKRFESDMSMANELIKTERLKQGNISADTQLKLDEREQKRVAMQYSQALSRQVDAYINLLHKQGILLDKQGYFLDKQGEKIDLDNSHQSYVNSVLDPLERDIKQMNLDNGTMTGIYRDLDFYLEHNDDLYGFGDKSFGSSKIAIINCIRSGLKSKYGTANTVK